MPGRVTGVCLGMTMLVAGPQSAADVVVLLQSHDLQQRPLEIMRHLGEAGRRTDMPRRLGMDACNVMAGRNRQVRRLAAAAVRRDQRTARRKMAAG